MNTYHMEAKILQWAICANEKNLQGTSPGLVRSLFAWVWMRSANFPRNRQLQGLLGLAWNWKMTADSFKQDWDYRVAFSKWLNAMPEDLYKDLSGAYLECAFKQWWPWKRLDMHGHEVPASRLIPYEFAVYLSRKTRKDDRRKLAGLDRESIERKWGARKLNHLTPKLDYQAQVRRF